MGRGKSLGYAMLAYVQTNRDLKECFLHLHFESISAIEQDEASLETASQHPELIKETSTKTYMYTCIEHDNIKLAFCLYDANNSVNQNELRRFPEFFPPLAEKKSGMRD